MRNETLVFTAIADTNPKSCSKYQPKKFNITNVKIYKPLNPALTDVKGLPDLICHRWYSVIVIANTGKKS